MLHVFQDSSTPQKCCLIIIPWQCLWCWHLTQSHCVSSPTSRNKCRTAPDGCRPLDQADGLEPLAGLQVAMKLHPPSPFITHPGSRYSFYHPTEGRRLSWCCTTLWDIPFNILNLLLQWNGDITSRHASTGNTVLHVVCAGGHTDLVQFLLAAYDDQRTQLMHMYNDLPVNLLNFDGHTSLMLAADRGNHYAFTQDFHTRGLSNKVGLICYLYKYLSFIQKSSQNPFISAGPRHIIRKSSPLNLVLVPRPELWRYINLLTYLLTNLRNLIASSRLSIAIVIIIFTVTVMTA